MILRKDSVSDTAASINDEDQQVNKKDDYEDDGLELSIKERQEYVHKFAQTTKEHITQIQDIGFKLLKCKDVHSVNSET